MKKVWIASILTILMLTVPLTSVVGANEVEDCNCNPISDIQVVRIQKLLDRLESGINFILSRYSHIPDVKEKCEEILGIIDSWEPFDIICEILEYIMAYMVYMYYNLPEDIWFLIFGLPSMIVYGIWFFLFCFLKY